MGALGDQNRPDVFCVDILAKLDRLQAEYEAALADYSFNTAAQLLYDFFWGNYCDLFLEAAKTDFTRERGSRDKGRDAARDGRRLRALSATAAPVHAARDGGTVVHHGLCGGGRFPHADAAGHGAAADGRRTRRRGEAQAKAAAVYETAGRIRNLKAACGLASKRDLNFILKPAGAVSKDVLVAAAAHSGRSGGIVPLILLYQRQKHRRHPDASGRSLSSAGGTHRHRRRARTAFQKELEKVQAEIAKVDAKLGSESFVSRARGSRGRAPATTRTDWGMKAAQLEEMLQNLQ